CVALVCSFCVWAPARLPCRGDAASEIAESQIRREPIVPSRLSAHVPSQLDDLVMSMRAKAPAQRREIAGEVGWRLTSIARRLQQRSRSSEDLAGLHFRRAG